jgi:WD40 repeat protein
MAQVQRHRRTIAATLFGFAAIAFAPATAEDQGPNAGTDLYDRPVLAIDPGMHVGEVRAQAVDAAGRFAVTSADDHTVRIWSIADGELLRTIWIPAGPEQVGVISAVAMSPDGSRIAAGGFTERIDGNHPIYIFDSESGNLIRRIDGDLPVATLFLTFSPDGRYLAATLNAGKGVRVFDRDKDWHEVFRDDQYGRESLGASFARDGRLATTSWDGLIRLYQFDPTNERPNFHRVGEPVEALSGSRPSGIAFSPDGKLLALGYYGEVVDILDGTTLERVGGHSPKNVQISIVGLSNVAWSRDGQTLFADGAVDDAQHRTLLFAWDRGGLGAERRMTYCDAGTATGVDALPDGRILVGSVAYCLGLIDAHGEPIWTVMAPILDLSGQANAIRVSPDGKLVDFGYPRSDSVTRFDVSSLSVLRFNLSSFTLSSPPPNDGLTFAPNHAGLSIDDWQNENKPTLNGRALPVDPEEMVRSLAIAPDAKRFFLGSNAALRAFDDAGAQIWRRSGEGEVWAVNASEDGRIAVAAYGDGTIRWHRADDGRELLALQVLPNEEKDPSKWDWVLWTPEGFYEATPGAQDVLKWVVNHGPDKAATTLPVSAIAKLHRPDALRLVLDQLETERALGIAEVAAARLDVQTATGSAKPPGGVLHVLAIGVDNFGDKAGGLHLDYAAQDAHDVATALVESQKLGPGKASLYADVKLTYLPNEEASKTAIEDALDAMADSMAKSGTDQDTAVILVSSHGEMIGGQFYFIPYGFVANGTRNAATDSAVPASVFAEKVSALAAHGKVLVLLDACHSGAVGAGGWATDPNAKVLQDAMDFENVTVLTSSKRNELSEELPEWKHGALAQAFLDALAGSADSKGIVTRSALTDAMENEVQSLTKGRQHLGMHVNFSGDLFVAGHY